MKDNNINVNFIRDSQEIEDLLRGAEHVDETDLKIIAILQKDGRTSFNTISSQLGISTATVSKRVKDLQDHQVITGFSAVVSCDQLGFTEHLWIMIYLEPGADSSEAGIAIKNLHNVKCVYGVLSDFDLMVHVCCATPEEISDTIKSIGKIKGVNKLTKVSVYSRIKEEFRIAI
ncbi:MAG: Lrp/AsnC family transcriptional regulator [Candidatus Thorarchaeota archaeon]